jgi:hypothetical protein
MYFSSLKRRTETCLDGEVKGEAGYKWGPLRQRFRVCGPTPISEHTLIRAPRNLDFQHFGW